MAARNIVAIAEKMFEKIPAAYQLNLGDMETLDKMSKTDAYSTAFCYGFALALRMVKRDARKNKAGSQGLEE